MLIFLNNKYYYDNKEIPFDDISKGTIHDFWIHNLISEFQKRLLVESALLKNNCTDFTSNDSVFHETYFSAYNHLYFHKGRYYICGNSISLNLISKKDVHNFWVNVIAAQYERRQFLQTKLQFFNHNLSYLQSSDMNRMDILSVVCFAEKVNLLLNEKDVDTKISYPELRRRKIYQKGKIKTRINAN